MNKEKILVFFAIFLSVLSFFYAVSLLKTQIVFGFDQARDAFEAMTIWQGHHLKIMGPSSDIPGLNHGVLWYYVLAVAYFLGNGIPENAAFVILIILYVSLPILGYGVYKMTKNISVAAISVILLVFSPLFISFSHWLSNPTLSLLIVPPLLFLLWKYLNKQTLTQAFLIGILYGLLIQSDFGFVILLLILPVYCYVFKLKFSLKNSVIFALGICIATATFFISYFKFHTNVVSIILGFIFRHQTTNFPVSATALSLIDNLIKLLTMTYIPLPPLLLFFVLLILFSKKRKVIFSGKDQLVKLLLVWLSGIVFIFIFNHGNLGAIFFFAPFLFPIAVLVAVYLVKIFENFRLLLSVLVALVLLQFITISSWARAGTSPLSVQQGMTTNFERQVVDYTYQSSGNKPFVITTITNPLFINTTWAYLYIEYGKQKYGYTPSLWGKDQTGYLGDLPMQTDLTNSNLRYLIMEPPEGIDSLWATKLIYEEDKLSDVVERKTFGSFVVEKRTFPRERPLTATPAALLEHPTVLNY